MTNLNIRISWQKPFNNYQPILAYKVLIQNSESTQMIENIMYCDGSKYTETSSNLFCDVPALSVLRHDPYDLTFNKLVVAQVQA